MAALISLRPDARRGDLLLLALVALLIAAFGLRTHAIGAQSFWNDEGNSYVQSLRTLPEIATHAGRDIHPPGYYWLLAIWRVLTGQTETAYRLFSALASLLTVALIYPIGRHIGGRAVGLLAALLSALNTFQIYYAQEARMYALLGLWSAASTLTLLRLIACPTTRRALIHGAITAAGLWTGYAFPFVMLAQGLYVVLALVRSRSTALFAHYLLANVAALLLWLPWLPTAVGQITTWPNTGQPVAPGDALSVILHWLIFGLTAPDEPLALPLILILFGLVGPRLRAVQARQSLQPVLPVLWFAIPLIAFLAIGLFREANLKHLLPVQPGVSTAIALGAVTLWTALDDRRRWVLRAAAVAGILWLLRGQIAHLPALYTDPAYQRDDYRAIAYSIEREERPGDVIILNAPNQAEVFGYYYRGDAPVIGLPRGLGGDDAAARAEIDQIIASYRRAFVVFWGEAERDPNRVIEGALNAGAFEIADSWYGDVRLVRYVFPQPLAIRGTPGVTFSERITLLSYALSADRVTPGDAVQVQFIWRAERPLDRRYAVFVQLLDANGALVAQRDSEPGGGALLTTDWEPGQPVADNHALLIPLDLPAGRYRLIAGLYDLDDPAARLITADGDDALHLAAITVE